LEQVGAPQEIYDVPATRFVAGFLGSPPMNLVPGGGVLGGSAGTVVGIRPEDIRIDDQGPIQATVTLVEALGSETILAVRSPDGTRLSVRTSPRNTSRPDDHVRLAVDPERLHVFDGATGARR
jgi:ABC-type sugar transport system ATPase subunit